ncbi:MAG: hypothetical protein K2X27_26840 [Candidatus Obscuribacterales bacterium]|nr:hypothetical protein [Candidatus Obscuribacterales bacterium]
MFENFDVRLLAPIATCLAITVTIILWVLNQKRKELSFQIVKRQSLFMLKGEAKKHLRVYFADNLVEDLQIIVVKVMNTGHLPINSGEYQGKLSINTGPGSTVLMGSVIESNPADLDERNPQKGADNSIIEGLQADRLFLRPLLLNAGDSYCIQLIAKNISGRISLSGHIQGIKSIIERKEKAIMPVVLMQIGALIMAGSMLIVDPRSLMPFQLEDVLPYLLLFLLGYVFLSAGMILPSKVEDS